MENLKSITTDGSKNMWGRNKEEVENDGDLKSLVLHCMIHQHSLYGKYLDMSEVLKPLISLVNFITSTGPNHQQCREFVEEIGAMTCYIILPYAS
ncbi:hypothetical protein Trydic_g6834 [Trypoxylus dichotomus]